MKMGYSKAIKGEVSVDIQKQRLIDYGVLPDHIYNGDDGQTIMDVVNSIREDSDQIVIYSGAVIGRWNLKQLMREMSDMPNALYSIKAEKEIHFNEGDSIASLIDDMEACERRNGGKGGKPNSIGIKTHKRIHKMRDDGMNSKEICAALGYDESKNTTVWRYMKKAISNAKA